MHFILRLRNSFLEGEKKRDAAGLCIAYLAVDVLSLVGQIRDNKSAIVNFLKNTGGNLIAGSPLLVNPHRRKRRSRMRSIELLNRFLEGFLNSIQCSAFTKRHCDKDLAGT